VNDRKEVAMDRDDTGMSDRSDEARQGDTGMIGSESEEPGPGRDTSLTDPDPVDASTDQPRGTVAMSEGDPMRTRLGSHVEGAGEIGYDVTAVEEGATQETAADDRPGYETERTAADPSGAGAFEHDPGLAAEPVVDQGAYEREPGGAGMAGSAEEPEYAERTEGGDQPLYQEETQRMDRPGGGGSLFTDEEPERLDRPGPQEPGVQDSVFDQEADQARRPSDGV
jgi:hypothetical protein